MSVNDIVDWMNEQDRVEDEGMADAILKLAYDVIANAPDGSGTDARRVLSGLLVAYVAQRDLDTDERDRKPVVTLSGNAAWDGMRDAYAAEYLRVQPKADLDYILECFTWPDCLGNDVEVPRGMLVTLGRRQARHDERWRKAMAAAMAKDEALNK